MGVKVGQDNAAFKHYNAHVPGEMQYTARSTDNASRASTLLNALGHAVRERRDAARLSRRALAARSGLSERFLAHVEQGSGNISVVRLDAIARALGTTAGALLDTASDEPKTYVVALIGLRGAGKSTLGRQVASDLGIPFVELDALVSERAGMPLSAVFDGYGEAFFRKLQREALEELLAHEKEPLILAAGGSVVMDGPTWDLLKARTTTVWLRASADQHWNRVVAQGDVRPMRGRADARRELGLLLKARKPLYAQSAHVVDTSERSAKASAKRVGEIAEQALFGASRGIKR